MNGVGVKKMVMMGRKKKEREGVKRCLYRFLENGGAESGLGRQLSNSQIPPALRDRNESLRMRLLFGCVSRRFPR